MDYLNSQLTEKIINLSLEEDIRNGDITTELIVSGNETAEAIIISKGEGIISGLPVAEKIFKKLDPDMQWVLHKNDGDRAGKMDLLAEMKGSLRAMLTGERTALNFMQRMSGISTAASKFVEGVKGFDVKILDTRKTAPGLRMLDKYAVKMGGAVNHRIGLYDMVMIKNNHIKAAGSITNAVNKVRAKILSGMKIEVETSNKEQVIEAVGLGVDIIMLDNMTIEMMKECVKIINHKAMVEASGGVVLDRVRLIAETGIDFISIGALTHSVKALDISQYIK